MSNPTALSIMNVHFFLVSYSMVKSIIAILFIFPLMFKTDIFHIMWVHDMIPIIAKRCQGRT